MDCSSPGSSVHGILQARIMGWAIISFPSGPSQPRDWTQISHIAGRFFTIRVTKEAPSSSYRKKKKKKETFSLCFFLQGRWSLCLALSVYFVDFPMNTHLCAHKGWWWSESGTSKCSSSVTPNTTCPWNIHVFCFLCEERGFTRHSPALTFRFHLLCWQINHCLVHQLFTQNLFKSMLLWIKVIQFSDLSHRQNWAIFLPTLLRKSSY